ncbi:MAG: bifunctional (p)ppGpp synthetase/guanosine-3',5'-bis(diphosphate) 3'-pyrophosphohydrolase [Syntrophomonadaceae bacterium]|nr:bifunctional (p)ppGpp synthetase/guanosine-3',5'-bis(diphosphate) 3'-pyrophosphohydrolase [Syntrophomonadaceae bacterium]
MEDIYPLLECVTKYNPGANTDVIEDAFKYASAAHHGQYRISGEDYINHPLATSLILAELGLDDTTIVAALLHDVVEDSGITIEEIVEKFGEETGLLVDGVTKLNRIDFKSKEDAQAEYLRKMFFAMAKDIRVILIKLADRLHNMRTLKHQNPAKQIEISQETIDIYAPLAHRLGIFRFKWELEDIALRYLEPDVFYELVDRIKIKRKEREEYVQSLIHQLKESLDEVSIEADIAGRPKSLYSIYNKMLKQGKDLDEIYDKIAIRVVVKSVRDCYGVLGVIHTLWKPLPRRFKDYIATPKANMYQSLHTTLVGKGGEPFEVQIKTWDMHRTAEYGIAAHWRYKEGTPSDQEFEEKLSWLRRTLEWQQDVKDTKEFMESLRIDLFTATVFVFTPKGDVIELPADACPVDFAYRVHTEVGHRCVGAKVNGRIAPLDFKLSNGDIVEILTSKQSPGPSRDWLNFVKTSQARSRIKAWFKREQRQENIIKGRDNLEVELKKHNLEIKEFLKEDRLLEIGRKFSFTRVDDLYAAIGDGAITANQVIGKLTEEYFRQKKLDDLLVIQTPKPGHQAKERASNTVRVKGVEDVMARLSHCCNPLPGDEVVGYITRGKGVSVHHVDCPNLKAHIRMEPDRIVEVEWVSQKPNNFTVEIEVLAVDRHRLTTDIMNVIADAHSGIHSVFSRANRNSIATINLKLEIKDLDHLQAIMQRISKVKDVLEVKRVVPTAH